MALFEKHIHYHCDSSRVLELLQIQAKKIDQIMANLLEIKALIVEQKEVITEVAGDIAELIAKLEGGLTAAETQEVFDALKENVVKLKEAAAIVPEPPVEPPVEG
jgi:Zn-dependent M32 family carboxypeptidase